MNRHLWLLLLSNFAIGTGAMMISGMLPALAQAFGVSMTAAGLLLTVFGTACAVGAPLLASLLAAKDKRLIASAALTFYGTGHLVAIWVEQYSLLLLLRFITAFAAAIFTATAAGLAAASVAPAARAKAIGLVFLGWSLASVLGLPAALYITAHWGWQSAMLSEAALCFTLAVLCFWILPRGVTGQAMSFAIWGKLLQNKLLMQGLAVTVLCSAGFFIIFTYLAGLYPRVLALSPEQLSYLFAAYGIAGTLGAALAAKALAKYPPRLIAAWCLANTTLAMLLWGASSVGFGVALALSLLWGLGGFALNATMQARLSNAAGEYAMVAVAMNSSALYVGQALGSLIGGVLYALPSPYWLPLAAAAATALALWVSWGLMRD